MPYVVIPLMSERTPYSYVEIPSEEWDSETGGGQWFSVLGGPVKDEFLPKRPLRAIKQSKKKDPEFTYASGSQPCVTEKVKDIIERFEPGVHQFFPVEIVAPNGTVLGRGRYMLNVVTLVDSIVEGKNLSSNPDDPHYSPFQPLVARAADIAGLHFWRDKRLPEQGMFMSVELFKALDGANCLRVDARPLALV
jgi:hypothetical protein